MRGAVLLLPLVVAVAGCPVTQPQDTPVSALLRTESATGRGYWLYVPSDYEGQRDWPLVVTLHGTHGWDSARAQIKEWKFLAEQRGLIVAAPKLRSVQGILPVVEKVWFEDLRRDERVVLAVINEVKSNYNIDPKAVMLTGFSSGGYPLYHVGLRHPEQFSMLVARSCNSDMRIFERITLSDAARKLPIFIYWGRDDPGIAGQSWQAFRWLREHRCFQTERRKIRGGHQRRPEIAYEHWRSHLPARHRR